ncbi:MAG: nucleotide exchange factor GrpE, partial [Lachnospiraceae bacterium]|nr:nucleotide exchange factor GrpE [Lachnospiraceae bacterium]
MQKDKLNEECTETEETVEQAEEVCEEAEDPVQEQDERDKKIAELEEQLKAEKDKLLRTAAEYANFRGRTEREKSTIYTCAVSDTVKELLPVADSMDRAIATAKDAPEEFKKGLDLINVQLEKTFAKLNITAFGEVGDEFNPELHDAISAVDSDELESNTVAQVMQKGYKINDKIIRHCMVQVVN